MSGNPISGQFYVDIVHTSLDSRLSVASIAERDAIAPGYRYQGMVVYVQDVNQHFEFVINGTNSAAAYADNNNWNQVDYHIHSNTSSLNSIGTDSNGKPTWNNGTCRAVVIL